MKEPIEDSISRAIAENPEAEVIVMGLSSYKLLKAAAVKAGLPPALPVSKYEGLEVYKLAIIKDSEFVVTTKLHYQKLKKEWEERETEYPSRVLSEVKKLYKGDAPLACNASEWLRIKMTKELFETLKPEERKEVRKAMARNYCIIKGCQYVQQVVEYRSQEYTSNFMPKIHDICIKYNLYSAIKFN